MAADDAAATEEASIAASAEEVDEDPGADEDLDRALPALLDSYLREIGHTPLLMRAQEVELARRVEQGDKAAADALAQANLRLVVSVARHYLNRGLPLEDLIAEGNIGLLRAVQKYEWRRGYRFSTLALWWIRQAIRRAIDETGRTIRLPAHVGAAMSRRARAAGELTTALGRVPTARELEAVAGADAWSMGAALRAALAPLSLSLAIGEAGEEQLGDMLPDEAASSPEEDALRGLMAAGIRQVLTDVLTERERAVLRLRFGLDDAAPQPLDVVGRRLGLTRERARQIEARALRKLRRPTTAARLRSSAAGPEGTGSPSGRRGWAS